MDGDMNFTVGLSADFSKTVTEYDIYGFAGITGDFNPLHVNGEKAIIVSILNILRPMPTVLYCISFPKSFLARSIININVHRRSQWYERGGAIFCDRGI